MKKLINFLIMMVMAVAVVFSLNAKKVNASSVTNKGSTVVMMNITMPTAEFEINLTAMIPANADWILKSSSGSIMVPQHGDADMMIYVKGKSADETERGCANFFEISSNTQMSRDRQTQWRCTGMNMMNVNTDVIAIMRGAIEQKTWPTVFSTMTNLNSSNAQKSADQMVQWRQSMICMTKTAAGMGLLNGANELKIWPDFYYFLLMAEEILTA